jgi:hypothetical protein
MIPYAMPGSFSRTTAWNLVNTIRAELTKRGLGSQFQGIAIAGTMPQTSSYSFGEGDVISSQGFLYLSPGYDNATFPYKGATQNPAIQDLPFEAPATLTATTPIGGKTFWPVSYIGYTGKGCIGPKAVLTSLDNAKSHDASKPGGTIYWMIGSDQDRNVRYYQIADVKPVWDAMHLRYSIIRGGEWVSGRRDIAGGILGATHPYPDQGGNAYLPGAFVDHLTSYGGVMDNFTKEQNSDQLNMNAWIRSGADGSSGTIAEPYNGPGKWAHGHIHTYLRLGASMGEAFWRNLAVVAESVTAGDPLVQPYADFPALTISAPAADSIVSGTISIQVSAQPTGGKTLEPNLDLFIDGRKIAIGQSGEPVTAVRTPSGFELNTSTLADGAHELRVVAYNADPIRTQNEVAVNVAVNNSGQAITLTGPPAIDRDGSADFTVSRGNAVGLTGIKLMLNGRVLKDLPAAGGTATIAGSEFPMRGPCVLYAVGDRSNGTNLWDSRNSWARLNVQIDWQAQPSQVNPSIGSGYATVRYFENTKASGFNWDTTPPTTTATYAGHSTDGFYLNSTAVPEITIGSYTNTPGYEVTLFFYAPKDDWYEFGHATTSVSGIEFRLNEKDIAPVSTAQHLAPGWHKLRFRGKVASGWSWKLWERGGYSRNYVLIPQGRAASLAAGGAPTPPTITALTATPAVVTAKTTQLNASATDPVAGDAAVLYTWNSVTGPASVTFSANGTNAARTTTATFTKSGTYVLGLRAASGSATAFQTITVEVQQTVTKLKVSGDPTSYNKINTFVGYPIDVYATLIDQFDYPTATQPTAVTWTTSAPGASITPTSSNGASAQFRSGSTTGGSISATATSTAGTFSGSYTSSYAVLTIKANTAPTLAVSLSRPSTTGPITLTMTVTDAEDSPYNLFASYEWAVVETAPGQTINLAYDYFRVCQATVSGPGRYTLTAKVTDGGGLSAQETFSIQVNADGTASYLATPSITTQPVSQTVLFGDKGNFSVVARGGALNNYQWQTSTNGGASWQDVSGNNSAKISYGPVGTADNGKQIRVVVSNALGSVTSDPATITLDNPSGGVMHIYPVDYPLPPPTAQGGTLPVYEDVGQIAFDVTREGGTQGSVSLMFYVSAFSATAGSDYTPPTTTTLSWASGNAATKRVVIPIIADAAAESTEYFGVEILGSGSTWKMASIRNIQVAILDGAGPPIIRFENPAYTVREQQGSLTIVVKHPGNSTAAITATYQTVAGTALPGSDFTATSGTLNWAAGDTGDKQIVIPILKDSAYDGAETFSVTLNSAALKAPGSTQVTIQDPPLQTWTNSRWPGNSDSAVVGENADPDGDGISNLFEYAFGLDPKVPAMNGTPQISVDQDRLQITFTRMKAADDIVYQVDASDDLQAWTQIWTSATNPFGGGSLASEQVSVKDVVSSQTYPKRFLRVRVTK